jgi:UDP-N-acetylmuramate--alanine ligase
MISLYPLSTGRIHLAGIGGIGMSGIAEILHNHGHSVQGSDQVESANVVRLREKGISVFIGHDPKNIEGVDVLVCSTAVKGDNPEVLAARKKHIPVISRAEMLAELMRFYSTVAVSGTHGKTTTTSLIASIFEKAKLDPTVINGGIINSYGTNTRMGQGNWMVVEADESDGTFIKVPATVAVVTNIDPEHLDYYGSYERLKESFHAFVQNIPFYGFSVLCLDHPVIQEMIPHIRERKYVTYGFHPQADVRVQNIRLNEKGALYDVVSRRHHKEFLDIELPMHGDHNIQNALAAIAVAVEMNISEDAFRNALKEFQGVKRRFTKTGEVEGITFIDDYAHHPVEIKAVLKAARRATKKKIIAVVQPHRFSRLKSLFSDFVDCFEDSDYLVILPVYGAGESPILGIDHIALHQAIQTKRQSGVEIADTIDAVAEMIQEIAEPGDYVVFLGAGNVTQWAQTMPEKITQLKKGAGL